MARATVSRTLGWVVGLVVVVLTAHPGSATAGLENVGCHVTNTPTVGGTPEKRTYRYMFSCYGGEFNGLQGEARGSYDSATKRVEEVAENTDGRLLAVWTCPADPWLNWGPRCTLVERKETYKREGVMRFWPLPSLPNPNTFTTWALDVDRARFRPVGQVQQGQTTSTVPAYGPDTCKSGFVWREAFDGDTVCVEPHRRDQVAMDNAQASVRRSPTGGAFGPDTCLSGWVWRAARESDLVCVTVEERARVAAENALADGRRLVPRSPEIILR